MPVSSAGHAGALVSEGGTATAPTPPPKSLAFGERKRADLMRLLTQRDWTST
jgi:hypothetical protein